MLARGYRPSFAETAQLMNGIPAEWCGEWEPTAEAIAANRARIAERLFRQQTRKIDESVDLD